LIGYKGRSVGLIPLPDLKPGLRHSATMRVGEAHGVPAQERLFGGAADMPPLFATAHMIAFVEWTCVAALAPYLAPAQRTLGTRVEISHTAATPIGMRVTVDVELVEADGRRLRFKVSVHDEKEAIGEGFHERTIVDHARFMARLARKSS
jgi:fluoroacetyl-CoA thioesterase